MRRALLLLTAASLMAGAMTVAISAAADRSSLAVPRALTREPALPRIIIDAAFFAPKGIFDLRAVQNHPVMKARRDYSLMAALPALKLASSGPALPFLTETRSWKISETLKLTFPLAISGRNLVTAEISGAGQVAVAPYGMAKGGVLTFSGAF